MKTFTLIYCAVLITTCSLLSCGNSKSNSEEEANILGEFQDTVNSSLEVNSDSMYRVFAAKFYSSLELTPDLNKKHSTVGGVIFNMDKFNSCIDNNSIFSKLRISNLTGEYHNRFAIQLLNIESVKLNNDVIEIYTNVEYSISEVGSFQNEEKLTITDNQKKLTLNKWEDIKLAKMEVAEYEGLENFNETEFYKMIGSVNK